MTSPSSKFLPDSIIRELVNDSTKTYLDYLEKQVASQLTYVTFEVLREVIPFEKQAADQLSRILDPLSLLRPKLAPTTTPLTTAPPPPKSSIGATTKSATGPLTKIKDVDWGNLFKKPVEEELKAITRARVGTSGTIRGKPEDTATIRAIDRVDTEYKDLVKGTRSEAEIISELKMRAFRTTVYPEFYLALAALFHVHQQKDFIGMRFLSKNTDSPSGRFLELLFPDRNVNQELFPSPFRLFTPYLSYMLPIDEVIGEPDYLRERLRWFDRLSEILAKANVPPRKRLETSTGRPIIPRAPDLSISAMETILAKADPKETEALFCGPEWDVTKQLTTVTAGVPPDFTEDKKDSSIFYVLPVMFPPRRTKSENAILYETVVEQLIVFFQERVQSEFDSFNTHMRGYEVGSNYQIDIRLTYLGDIFSRILNTKFFFEFPGNLLAELRLLAPNPISLSGTLTYDPSTTFHQVEVEKVFPYFSGKNLENIREMGTFLVIFKYLYTIYYYCKKDSDLKAVPAWTSVFTKELCNKILTQVRLAANTSLTEAPLVRNTLPSLKDEDEVAIRAKTWTNIGDFLQQLKLSKEQEQKIREQAEATALISIRGELSKREVEEKAQMEKITKEKIETAKTALKKKEKDETFKVVSWNVLSHHLIAPLKEGDVDPANPTTFYSKITKSVAEEKRMENLRRFLFEMTRDISYRPDFLCLQQVSVEFASIYFPDFTTSSKGNLILEPYWNSSYKAIFILDEVSPLQKLPFAGKQGILLMWNTDTFELKPENVQHFPSTFGYYLGSGSSQLFALFSRKAADTKNSLLFCAAESYPQSWPLLSLDPTKMENVPSVTDVTPDLTYILTLIFTKPSIYYQKTYVNLQKPFDATEVLAHLNLPDWIKETFHTERPILPENKTCSTTPRYTEYDVNRYRFLIFDAMSRIPVPPNLQYIREKILSLSTATMKVPQVDDNWKNFNPGTQILLIIDSIYSAEADSLFFNERLETMNATYHPDQILACITFPYNTSKTRLSEYASGYGAKWIDALKGLAVNDNQIRLTSVVPKDTPTWWLPSFIDKCKGATRDTNLNQGCEPIPDKGSLSSCTLLPDQFAQVEYGIVADHIFYKSSLPIDLAAEKEYEEEKVLSLGTSKTRPVGTSDFSLKDLKLKLYETKGTAWGQSDKVDLSEYFSDHVALEATFQWALP